MKCSIDIQESLRAALNDYQAGRLEEAKATCLELLELLPGQPDCLYLLGLIYYNFQQYDLAIDYLKKTIVIDPSHADAHFNLGNAFQGKGQFEKAIEQYRSAAALNPGNADILNNMGVAFTAQGAVDEAITCYQEAIRHDPDSALSFNNLGNAFRAKGNYDGAVQCFKRAIRLDPNAGDFFKNMGNALRDKGQMDEALACYLEALQLSADDADVHYNIANLHKETGRAELAVASYREALQVNPQFTEACYNLGNVLREMGRYDEAIDSYKRTLELVPDYLEAYNNMGVAFKEKGDTGNAIACYENALKIGPEIAEAQWNLSLVYLLAGEFEEGWKRYEWRWQKTDYRPYLRHFSQPLWDGSGITGKKVLLHAEQGYGDAIQFVRYAPWLTEKGIVVFIEVPKELKVLFETVTGVHQVIQRGDILPEFDFHCPLLTLPMIFHTGLASIPDRIPYLAADPKKADKWRAKLAADGGVFKVGLVWSGNPEHKNDRNRSIPWEGLTPLLSMDHVLFYSLQKGEASKASGSGTQGGKILDYTEELKNFADTAALMMNLDLIISVDTAVAHLAGALGKPVWMMLPFAPDWRWLLDRKDSPWYPTMRLIRQPKHGAWGMVIEEIIIRLKEFMGDRI